MPKRELTAAFVDALNQPGDFFDTKEPGLILRMRCEGGSKKWQVRYRTKGRYRRFTIGDTNNKKLSDARKEAKRLLAGIQSGDDPQAIKEQERNERPQSLKELIEDYIELSAKKNHKNWKPEYRLFEMHVYPKLGSRLVEELTRRDFKILIDNIAGEMPGAGREVLKHLKLVYAWAMEREDVSGSPLVGITIPLKARYKPRERHLSDAEIIRLWPVWGAMAYPFGTWFQTLIVTGQRRTEVGQMRWRDLDLDKAIWTIPADHMKNKKVHEVPLSPLAVKIINNIPKSGNYVFTTTGEGHIKGFSKAKAKCDRLEALAADEMEPLENWTVHDLRRTVATGMGELGIAPHIIEAVQGRSIEGIAKTYNRAKLKDAKRNALETWTRHVMAITDPDYKNNVVTISA